jgi:hypothetical protein
LVIPPLSDQVLERIAGVDNRIRVVDARGWFDGELRATWPQWTVARYLGDRKFPPTSLEKRNDVLASAEVVLLGWPPLKDIRARAPHLKWVHQTPAGASNLLDTDLWGSAVIVTTSRGLTNRRPMAEYVLACFLHFTRGLHLSYRDRLRHHFDHSAYNAVIIRDKTVCVIGAGGIGQEVGRLCALRGCEWSGRAAKSFLALPSHPVFFGSKLLQLCMSCCRRVNSSQFAARGPKKLPTSSIRRRLIP